MALKKGKEFPSPPHTHNHRRGNRKIKLYSDEKYRICRLDNTFDKGEIGLIVFSKMHVGGNECVNRY